MWMSKMKPLYHIPALLFVQTIFPIDLLFMHRNVQCARCGEWGHRSGDRECALKDYNPNDYERQRREDPMQAFISNNNTTTTTSSSRSSSGGVLKMVTSPAFVDENGESDPEAEFLASLTRREKALLLKKLQVNILMI